MVEIGRIPQEKVQEAWPSVSKYVLEALLKEPEMQTEQSIRNGCLSGEYALLSVRINGIICGAATLSLEDTPQSRLCMIITLGGDKFSVWKKAVFTMIERLAKDAGCSGVLALGRKGWERTMPDYTAVRTVYYKGVQ